MERISTKEIIKPMTWNKGMKGPPPKRYCVPCLLVEKRVPATHVIDGAGYCQKCKETAWPDGDAPAVTVRQHHESQVRSCPQRGRKLDVELSAQAAALFRQGKNVSEVASAIGVSWPTAKKMRDKWALTPEVTVEPIEEEKPVESVLEVEPEVEDVESSPDEGEFYSVPVVIPAARVNDIFGTFSLEEKFAAIGHVIQQRMDVALGIGE
jgi:transposase-like protein